MRSERLIITISLLPLLLAIWYDRDLIDAVMREKERAFAAELLKNGGDPSKSLIIAPHPIKILLSMLVVGAGGSTKQQLSEVLGILENDPYARYHTLQFVSIMFIAEQESHFEDVFNAYALFINENIHLHKGAFDWYNFTFSKYDHRVERVDFSQSAVFVEKMNKWVANLTKSRMATIVNESSFGADTDIALISASYLRGKWDFPFNKAITRKAIFYESNGKERTVEMMERRGMFKYGNFVDATTLEMYYEYKGEPSRFDERTILTVILPKAGVQLAQIEANLAKRLTTYRIFDQKEPEVDAIVNLPKFIIENEFDLADALKKMGITEIFGAANFSQMTNESVSVSKVLQKIYFEVSEDGGGHRSSEKCNSDFGGGDRSPEKCNSDFGSNSETVAKETVFFGLTAMKPIHFKADHPFIFVIQRRHNLLFIGRYC